MLRKLILFAGAVFALAAGGSASAALLAYEGFNYSEGTAIIGAGGVENGFSGAWQANSSQGVANTLGYSLGYVDTLGNSLVTSGGAGFFQGLTTAGSAMQPVRQFDFIRGTNGVDGTTTWISMIMVRQGPTGTLAGNPYGRGVNVTFDDLGSSGGNQHIALGNSSGNGQNTIGILSAGGNIRNGTTTFGANPPLTNFVVLRIDHIAGAAALDNAYLWVNPLLGTEPLLATAQTNVLGLWDYSMDRTRIFVGGSNSLAQPYGELRLDELRVGETFADVAPFAAVPEPVVGAMAGLMGLAYLLHRRRV